VGAYDEWWDDEGGDYGWHHACEGHRDMAMDSQGTYKREK